MGQTPPTAAFPTTVVRCFSKEAVIYMGQDREIEGEGIVRHILNVCHICHIYVIYAINFVYFIAVISVLF